MEVWLLLHKLLMGLVGLALSGPAWGACPGVMADCPVGSNTKAEVAAIGLKADGVTSDDVALKALVDQCAAGGGRLVLPAGRILLTGAATIQIRNCHIVGTGVVQSTKGDVASYGTTILLTSTTVKPFTMQNSWGITGVQFYWPNQLDGVTPYPPLFSPTAGDGTSTYGWYLDQVTIVNAYDGIVASGGSFRVTNSWLYAVNDMFRISNIGDSFYVSGVHFTPGPWDTLTAFASNSLLDVITQKNTVFHFVGGGNGAINFSVTGSGGFAWRYGFKVDAGAEVGLSEVNFGIDGVGTYLDTATGGGQWANANNPIRGVVNCNHVGTGSGWVDNKPCFNLGGRDWVVLQGFSAGAKGTFVQSAGSSIVINNSSVPTIGGVHDGGDYYLLHQTANAGGVNIIVNGSEFQGNPSDAHVHGITTDVAVTRLSVQNNVFGYFNDDINIQSAPTTLITGNWSVNTNGSSSVLITGANGVIYNGNVFDKPPLATLANCGTGPVSHGGFAGYLTTGTGAPTTCDLTLPWVPYGAGGGSCVATVNAPGVAVQGGPSGIPPTWHLQFSPGTTSANVFYNCQGQQ